MVEARTREPWVIALASQKGGVGKTTLALELAAVFADTSGRALVVDIDPQRTAEEIITASNNVGFDFAAEDDLRVLERLRSVRDYDAIIVDCPGNLEDTETLAGVLASATYAVIPMVPERAAVQPTLRTARLCGDHKVSYRVVVNMADPLRGAGPVEAAWGLLDDLDIPRMVSFVRRYVAHSQAQLDGRMITEYRGDRSWANALADVRRVQGEMLLELGRLLWRASARPSAHSSVRQTRRRLRAWPALMELIGVRGLTARRGVMGLMGERGRTDRIREIRQRRSRPHRRWAA
jgi:chromosome partitioning protein